MIGLADFSAVIFDMDGLVLDTESTYMIAWKQAAKKMGYHLSNDFCLSLSGLHYRDVELKLISHLGPDFDWLTFVRLSGGCWLDYVKVHGISVKHGFFVLLEWLKEQNIPYCLATNSKEANARECLEMAGIKEVFSIIVAREHVCHGKPAPDIFIKAAKLLRTDICRCLVIEDSQAGIVAASQAGAISVFVPSTGLVDPLSLELCNLAVDDLVQLSNYFLSRQ